MCSVAVQLKTLIAEGTATMKLMKEKTRPASRDCPVTNMWWPQTKKPTAAIARLAQATEILVAEHRLARKARDQLVDHAHAGQDHDVDSRMRVEPE